jgi:hypothetical protein
LQRKTVLQPAPPANSEYKHFLTSDLVTGHMSLVTLPTYAFGKIFSAVDS